MEITPKAKGLAERVIFADGAGCRLRVRESILGPGLYVISTDYIRDKREIALCALDVSEKDLPIIAERIKDFVRETRRRRYD